MWKIVDKTTRHCKSFVRPSSHVQIQMWWHAELYHRIDQQPSRPTQYWQMPAVKQQPSAVWLLWFIPLWSYWSAPTYTCFTRTLYTALCCSFNCLWSLQPFFFYISRLRLQLDCDVSGANSAQAIKYKRIGYKSPVRVRLFGNTCKLTGQQASD